VITDALLAPLLALARWLANTLPDGQPLDTSGVAGLRDWLAGLNSLLPVAEVMGAALGLLAAVLVFLLVRLVLVVRHTLLP
jgi:hypothetical protein